MNREELDLELTLFLKWLSLKQGFEWLEIDKDKILMQYFDERPKRSE